MPTTLFAQPYDISASGFYFSDASDYEAKVKCTRNDFGYEVEEFEIQFIDGDDLDCALAAAIHLNQANVSQFFDLAESLDDWDKLRMIIAYGECGYCFESAEPDLDDIDLYELESLRELAEQFVDEGLLGDVPDNFMRYFDYDAFARDLACDYTETTIAGQRLVYRCS